MTKKEYKKAIDEFISHEYDHLLDCAKNILRSKRYLSNDLVSELAVFLYQNQNKLQFYVNGKILIAFCLSWMKLQCSYKTTPFNLKYIYNQTSGDEVIPDLFDWDKTPTENEYISDLETNYSDDQIKNILLIHKIYPTLTPVNQILFQAYFIEGLTYDKIKEKYTFFKNKCGKKVYYKSKTSIFLLMKELKQEIKNKIKEYDTTNFRNNSH